jgi:hypothetical protein
VRAKLGYQALAGAQHGPGWEGAAPLARGRGGSIRDVTGRPYARRVVVAGLLRLVSVVASALVLIGFLLFAIDETRKGSEAQIRKLEGINRPDLGEGGERAREQEHSGVREAIDDANDVLLSPFTDIVDSDDIWVDRAVPGALALLVYGLGLGVLANYFPGRRRRSGGDWRAA